MTRDEDLPAGPGPTQATQGQGDSGFRDALIVALTTRKPTVTYVLLVIIVALGLISGLGSLDSEIMRRGVLERGAVEAGELWRLVTPVFLHFGIMHLLFNSIALRQLGMAVEAIYGRGRFLAMFLLSGVAGNLVSLIFVDGISAGASGAVFGLMGATIVFGIKHARDIPPALKSSFGTGAIPLLAYNVVFGLTIPNINNYAHGGGLLCGAAMALLLTPQIGSAAIAAQGRK